MDLFHIWHHLSPISRGVACHFGILKNSRWLTDGRFSDFLVLFDFYLIDYVMDLYHIWHHLSPMSGGVTHHFGILNKIKMVDLQPFKIFYVP